MMFNYSDPTLWSLCLRAALGKKENPTDLVLSLWQGFDRYVIRDTIKFFSTLRSTIKKKMLQRKMKKKRAKRFPLKQANFELLALYAAASQANSSTLREQTYATWRRRRYPLGLVYDAQIQMALPLDAVNKKKVAVALFEAEANIRHQLSDRTVNQVGYGQTRTAHQQVSCV